MEIKEFFEKVELLKEYKDILIKLDFKFLDDSDNSGLLLYNNDYEISFYENIKEIQNYLEEIKKTIDI